MPDGVAGPPTFLLVFVVLLGCRESTSEIRPPLDEPDAKPTGELARPGPGVLEMTVGACAITPDSRVWCRDTELLAEKAGFIPEASEVDRIWLIDETLCLRSEGQVRCMYPEDPFDPPLPGDGEGRPITPSAKSVVDLGWGSDQQCLVDEDGALWCRWLPFESDVPLPPLERYPITGVRDIEISDEIGCMLLADESVHCFFGAGILLTSELDRALSATVGEYCAAVPTAPHCDQPIGGRGEWPAPFRVLARGRDMAIGFDHACLIDENGAVGCVTLMGMPGQPRIGSKQDFAAIPGLPRMVEIDGSDDHVCGRSETDEVWCWGSNEFGQLGDGTTKSHIDPHPVKVGQWPGLEQISVGFGKSCVVAAEGIECWGWLTDQDGFDPTPTEIPGIRANELASREYTTCAHEAKSWKCWGGETRGLEGAAGAAKIVEVPTRVDRPAPECVLDDKQKLSCFDDEGTVTVEIPDVVAAAPGYSTLCLLLDRKVMCMSPSLPQLGRTEFEVPASTAISGLDWHGCVLDARGKARCWNEDHVAKAIDLDAKLVAVVASSLGDCGLDRAGVVHCWGEWTKEGRPFALGLAKIVELVGGTSQICARDHEGSVWCWGRGVEFDRAVPPLDPSKIAVPAVQQIVAGFDHVCALASDGRVLCWGSEIESQRARLSPAFVLEPKPIDFFGP